MIVFEGDKIDKVYARMVENLLVAPEVGATREINNAIFIVHNPTLENISFPYRKPVSLKYADGELKWYWSADNSCHTIGQYAKLWLKLTDDGETNNSAYGFILFKKYGFNQLEQIIELLKKDSTTRRAVLNISDPTINRITTKDMQCTIALDFLIRNGQLEETVIMRSNDISTGTPYDYIFFVSLGQYIARRLNIKLSLYTHHAISLHMYLRDIEQFTTPQEKQVFSIDVDKIINENYEYEKNNL